jgi:hypothetical protein
MRTIDLCPFGNEINVSAHGAVSIFVRLNTECDIVVRLRERVKHGRTAGSD